MTLHAADLFTETCHAAACDPHGIVLHADNRGPMKGATMLATLKYCPAYPSQPFADAARARMPGRWSGRTRDWSPITTVRLNPERVPSSNGSAHVE